MTRPFVSYFDADRAFGYVTDAEDRRWFHATTFHRRVPGGPGPILGEHVRIESLPKGQIAVYRIDPPQQVQGVVRRFDPAKGWGFIEDPNGISYFTHRKDANILLRVGMSVRFYLGSVPGKGPRACHVHRG